jgi:hypothetical protein
MFCLIASMLCVIPACQSPPLSRNASAGPGISVREASSLQFRGANSPDPQHPGDVDCNSPAHWNGDTLYVFNSSGHPWRLSGPDVFHLSNDYRRVDYSDSANGGRWIECTWEAGDGTLYGWYHFEPTGVCPGRHPENPNMSLTAPRIGAVMSKDNGATWENLGVVLETPPLLRCDTRNYYFAGGNGDFSAMLDGKGEYLYFFISTYAGETPEQGVGLARMAWKDRDHPTDKVWKWHEGNWREPGLGGGITPIFPAAIDWHRQDADAFWGPSVHWNSYLKQYVMLLNRAVDGHWKQEGIYISFNKTLNNPLGWSVPKKILDSPGADRWYPQVMGIDATKHETDKVAGKVARLFVRGLSRWEIVFQREEVGSEVSKSKIGSGY